MSSSRAGIRVSKHYPGARSQQGLPARPCAAQPGDVLPAALLERLGQGGFGQRVASPLGGKDRDRRDPPRQKLGGPAFRPEHRSSPLDRDGRIVVHKPLVRRQRQNQPAALRQLSEPRLSRSGRPGVPKRGSGRGGLTAAVVPWPPGVRSVPTLKIDGDATRLRRSLAKACPACVA